jgi:lipopolysaccharide transport system permease protein
MSQTFQHAVSADLGDAASDDAGLQRERRLEALADLRDGIVQWPLWIIIAWMEIRQRYRRSLLGPFWITLSLGFFVLGLGVVYGALFRMELKIYLPYLATGVIVWTMISSFINEGCSTFISAERAIKQIPVPISVHVYRMVWRNLIIFAHNFLIYLLLVPLFGIQIGLPTILLIPGLFLIMLNGVGFGLSLGVLSARFRDIPMIITNLVQLVFFTTPILWQAATLSPDHAWVAWVNPFYYLIESVREPLLGQAPSLSTWMVTIAMTVANLAVAVSLYARCRARIAYWL